MKKMRYMQFTVILTAFVSVMALFFACPAASDPKTETPPPEISGVELEDQPAADVLAGLFGASGGFPAALSNSWKIWGHHNALITQGFGADPTALPYKDRLYIISSNDTLLYNNDGVVDEAGGYNAGIQGLRVLSSADLANWTDHGLINVGDNPEWTNPLYLPMPAPVTPFKSKSWAPSAVWAKINGKDKFFIYFGDSGDGIGVISADSPTGPWKSPLNKLLIDRDTPNCAKEEVANLFDPGAFVDNDGWGYLYFGGGGTDGHGRRVKLGKDLISLADDPEVFSAPCLFEDNEFTKIGDLYYYSYVTNGASNKFGLGNAQIAYMTAWEPMADFQNFSNPKGIMASPQSQLGTPNENNHHCIFTFKDEQYITYHASTVSQAIGLTGVKYRSTHIEKITVDGDGTISTIKMTRTGVEPIGNLNPYLINEAETIGIQGGVFTRPEAGAGNGMVLTSIDSGDWIALYGVDFGSSGAKKFIARVRTPDTPADYVGAIEIRLDPEGDGEKTSLNATKTATIKGGEVIGRVQIKAKAGDAGNYGKVTIDLDKTVTGVHDLVFVFYSSLNNGAAQPITKANLKASHHKNGFEFDQWQFTK